MSYVTDPIGDFITRIRNAQRAGKKACSAPWSRMKEQLAELLKKEDWIESVEVKGEAPKQDIVIGFHPEKMNLTLSRISKPGRRVYTGANDLKPVLHGYGMAIVTTSHGLMTDAQARKKKIGGEVLCTVS